MPRSLLFFSLIPLLVSVCSGQTPKDVRAVAKQGQIAIPTVAGYLNSAGVDTRIEAVKQLTALGGKDTVEPLIRATKDADPEMQILATDGLVNYYLPGYVRQGLGSTLIRAGASVKAKFSDANDQIIDAFVIVRPDVIAALGQLARGGSSMDSRANACRAIGILRGRAALPDLIDALRSKDNNVMYESLAAMQKIGDPAAGPRITYLLRDLDDRVQMTAISTAGTLRSTDALPTLRAIIANPRNAKAERAALGSIAMMPAMQDRDLFLRELGAKDEKIRAAAAEGLGRIGNRADEPTLDKSWQDEEKIAPRLAAAFGLVMEGRLDLADDAPFRYLINNLNSAAWHDTAYAYLVEAARRKPVLEALSLSIDPGSKEEKIYLARVLSASGDRSSVSYLDKVSRDSDQDVSKEGLRALRSLRARLGI
ncbi:MAG TPA: HEAT repeat domain-containing protein [Bryobacteraceae bacterium]|jgi:HEAT repeat protein|nr:HEAT repeat domain-containing protein [Bryobacteraceae bacterium]